MGPEGPPGLAVSFPERRVINKEGAEVVAAELPDSFSAKVAAREVSAARAEQVVPAADRAEVVVGRVDGEGWDAKPSIAFVLVFTTATKTPRSTPDPFRSPATKFPNRAITTNDLAATSAARSKFPTFTTAATKLISSSTISTRFNRARSIPTPPSPLLPNATAIFAASELRSSIHFQISAGLELRSATAARFPQLIPPPRDCSRSIRNRICPVLFKTSCSRPPFQSIATF